MLQEVFYWAFNMSITASLAGGLVVLIRLIKPIPRRMTVLLWAIPFLRMVLPFGLNSPWSLMSLLSGVATKTVVVYQPTDALAFSMMNSLMVADTYFPITYKINLLENIFRVASVIWIAVTVAMMLMLAITYVATTLEVRRCVNWKDNLYLSNQTRSPWVYGIWKPKIILPVSFLDLDLEYILLHENCHIRRSDNLWRLLGLTVVAVHWYNPLSWLMLKCFLADLELACDESVLTKIEPHQAKEYALSLLNSKQGSPLFTSAFGGAKIKTRIERILSYQRLTWLSLITFTTLIGAVFYVLLTNGR